MNEYLLKMVDGGLIDYQDDCYNYSGCPTCDYGSEYITEINITLENYKIFIKTNQMYEYALSESDMMKLLLRNYEAIQTLTEKEFVEWFKNKFFEITYKECVEKFDVSKI